jgi:DTW domain-containing protein
MPDARATCYDCLRPSLVCICDVLQPVDNRTRVTILQHPRERRHPLNTARIAEGSLTNVRVLRGNLERLSQRLAAGEVPTDALLLYPGPDAVDLETLPPTERPREIVILDGTWHHASTLLRDLPVLGSLRCARFTPISPSEYQIRKEPRADYLSTIESIAHVLSVLEPETTGIESMRDSFRALVSKNITARRPEQVRRTCQRERRAYAFPEELALPPDRLVLAYAEGALIHSQERRRQPLVTWLLHPDSGETLRLVLRPPGPVRTRLLAELQLSEAELDNEGLEPEVIPALLTAFLGERVLAAWNASTFAMLAELGAQPAGRLALKATYCDHRRALNDRPATWGSMRTILAARGIGWESSGGRAERRLAQTKALYEYLREVASSAQVGGVGRHARQRWARCAT